MGSLERLKGCVDGLDVAPLTKLSSVRVPVTIGKNLRSIADSLTAMPADTASKVWALSTISLMSGGEMAFVAIALYFAILKVRPTPFCVMAEIEAALDEANVSRYASYMRRMAGKTQFLVITHRRGTMEEADMLYGVTMQEKGVSTVLELDLETAQKTIEE